ncbi:MAG: hypothetical protein ACYTG5_11665 [Planctomycetota bacterium]|jgi:hypothetical protein
MPGHQSPEARYASLHRAVEAGLAKDQTWGELVSVCIRLNKPTEALEALHRIDDQSLRARAGGLLMRHGLMTKHHAEAHHPEQKLGSSSPETFKEEIYDSFRFLFLDHMPLTVMVMTMIFPVVIGVGGLLTQGTNSLVLPLIALIPALSTIGLVGALSRQILLDASRGISDPPALPAIKPLTKDAGRFLLDGIVLSTVLLGPGLLLWQFTSLSILTKICVLGFGALFLPMAMAMRQTCEDWRALNPKFLIPCVSRGGLPYVSTVGFSALILSPAVISLVMTSGAEAYLRISVLGPLSVVPLIVIARLMGRVLDIRRRGLGELLEMPIVRVTQQMQTVAELQARRHQGQEPASSQRPRQQARPQGQPSQRKRPPLNSKSHPEAQKPSGGWQPRPVQAPPAQQGVKKATDLNLKVPESIDAHYQETVGEEFPDLTKLPGACVYTGKARDEAGASSATKKES